MFPLYTEVYTEDNKTQKLLYFEERPVDAAALNSKFYGASAMFINRSKQQCLLLPFIRCIEYSAFDCTDSKWIRKCFHDALSANCFPKLDIPSRW